MKEVDSRLVEDADEEIFELCRAEVDSLPRNDDGLKVEACSIAWDDVVLLSLAGVDDDLEALDLAFVDDKGLESTLERYEPGLQP